MHSSYRRDRYEAGGWERERGRDREYDSAPYKHHDDRPMHDHYPRGERYGDRFSSPHNNFYPRQRDSRNCNNYQTYNKPPRFDEQHDSGNRNTNRPGGGVGPRGGGPNNCNTKEPSLQQRQEQQNNILVQQVTRLKHQLTHTQKELNDVKKISANIATRATSGANVASPEHSPPIRELEIKRPARNNDSTMPANLAAPGCANRSVQSDLTPQIDNTSSGGIAYPSRTNNNTSSPGRADHPLIKTEPLEENEAQYEASTVEGDTNSTSDGTHNGGSIGGNDNDAHDEDNDCVGGGGDDSSSSSSSSNSSSVSSSSCSRSSSSSSNEEEEENKVDEDSVDGVLTSDVYGVSNGKIAFCCQNCR